MPACVGRPPGAAGLNVNVIPAAPEPLKKELPAVPEPSIAPSSASTESVIPPGANGAPADAVTFGTLRSPSSKVSIATLPLVISAANGLSAWLV